MSDSDLISSVTIPMMVVIIHGSSQMERNLIWPGAPVTLPITAGWLLAATQDYDATNVVLQCVLSHGNRSVNSTGASSSCPSQLSWFEGLTKIQESRRVSQVDVASINLTVPATSFGKYTCHVVVDNEELTVSVWLVPEGEVE